MLVLNDAHLIPPRDLGRFLYPSRSCELLSLSRNTQKILSDRFVAKHWSKFVSDSHWAAPCGPCRSYYISYAVLIDIDLMFHCGGLRILLQALAEGPVELAPTIVTAFLYVVDAPRTRLYFNPGTDLEVSFRVCSKSVLLTPQKIALSGVTDAYGRGTSYIERMRGCTKVISVILRSWSGSCPWKQRVSVLTICSRLDVFLHKWHATHPRYHKHAQNTYTWNTSKFSIPCTCSLTNFKLKEVILDLFFELLDIDTPEWFQTFIDGRRLTSKLFKGDNSSRRTINTSISVQKVSATFTSPAKRQRAQVETDSSTDHSWPIYLSIIVDFD